MKIFDFRLLLLALPLASGVSCSEEVEFPEFTLPESSSFLVSQVILPANGIELYQNENEITIQGKGFLSTDKIYATMNEKIELAVTAADEVSVTCTLPEMESGKYELTVTRDGVDQSLGMVIFEFVPYVKLEVEGDENIYGRVYCGDEAVVGAVISDGVEVVQTDEFGIYRIESAKKYGKVFISVPKGYKVAHNTTVPSFFNSTTRDVAKLEEFNFPLEKCDKENFTIFVPTDVHLANRTNDLAQFTAGFQPDLLKEAAAATAAGNGTLAIDLGDLSWDGYWYDNKYGLTEALEAYSFLPMPLYPTIGNHDHDPYYADDFASEEAFRDIMAPNYYSFNVGDVHVVILDNIVYTNEGGSIGTEGDRGYGSYLTADQLSWLAKDLATVTDKTKPVIVGMHNAPLSATGWDGNSITHRSSFSSTTHLSNMIAAFDGFSDVQIICGHQHENTVLKYENITMHCIGAVCATWWWTGYLGNGQICRDGSPAGYKIFDLKSGELSWRYKSISEANDYQFRAYDLNEVPSSLGGEKGSNKIMVNVWGWDVDWTLKAIEGGEELTITPAWTKDPLHQIAYTGTTSEFKTVYTHHLFIIESKSEKEPVTITATDASGVEYTQVLERPKMFSLTMK